jgi:PAS domain-containing protein
MTGALFKSDETRRIPYLGSIMMRDTRMEHGKWVREFPAAITVCDTRGTILELNERACATFEKDGGRELIGKNLLDCHPEPARTKLAGLLQAGHPNCYTIEKGSVWKMIYQAPWYDGGEYRGFVEVSFTIPEEIPHFVRDKPSP